MADYRVYSELSDNQKGQLYLAASAFPFSNIDQHFEKIQPLVRITSGYPFIASSDYERVLKLLIELEFKTGIREPENFL